MSDNCLPSCESNKESAIKHGILSGVAPHFFCIIFLLAPLVGVSWISALWFGFFLKYNLNYYLIFISLFLATISVVFYLLKKKNLNFFGIKRNWLYIASVYAITVMVNLILVFVVFPSLADKNSNNKLSKADAVSELNLRVEIPCEGHAPFISGEIMKENGVDSVDFDYPYYFKITYYSNITSPEKITESEIFRYFKPIIIN